jgi:multidrug efflux pump subunit AcrA (membrane-fusion protein)
MSANANPASIFRPEAVKNHASGEENGSILKFDDKWIRTTYVITIGFALASFLFMSLFSIDEYAMGPAVVRVDGRRMINAVAAGSVETVEVKPGEWVEAEQVMLRMSNTEELALLELAKKDFNASLVRIMRNPNDAQARTQLPNLRTRLDQAKAVMNQRVIRAPFAGYVTDVRSHPGQHVSAGDVLVSVAPKDAAQVSLVAMVSADFRPMLKRGGKMRFELDGFKYEYADLEVEEVSAEAIGTAEVQRFLGGEKAGVVQVEPGAKVLVTAKLPAASFSSEGQAYGYFDGLTGSASIRLRREPILVTLIPSLRTLIPQ